MSEHRHSGSEGHLLKMEALRVEAHLDGDWAEIVRGVDLVLRRRELLGLIGESGAGKSTIGLAAMGHVRIGCRISGGSVLFDGIELRDMDNATKRSLLGVRIAYVAQSAAAAFNPAHTIGSQVMEAATYHGVMSVAGARERAVSLFRQLQLPSPETFGNRYPHQVSGGQLQRAMLAMAMVCGPDMIVFDEPTTALDVTTQFEVLHAMKQAIQAEEMAGLYITHDLAVVAQLADRVMVLRHGETVEEGETRQIIEAPRADYTQQLLNVRKAMKSERRSAADDAVLTVEGITASYGGSGPRVLDDVSLSVSRGTTAAIVGESGSGKSTLARVATGLLPPAEGRLELDGEPLPYRLRQRTREQLRRLQMIYQMPDVSINPAQTIEVIIGRPLTLYFGMTGEARRERVAELLQQVDLPADYADRRPAALSGGQKQRIGIARALAAEPEVIICDEVTSALDQVVAQEILRLLLRLQDETNTSYVFITHDLATVRAIADTVAVMHQGRVVESGAADKILANPTTDYAKLLLSSVPEMKIGWLEEVTQWRAQRTGGKPQEQSPSRAEGDAHDPIASARPVVTRDPYGGV